ncbi:MAG TPA: hypothetical protein ENI63_02030 [Candidatus Kaiserbacteria bacterium]|nr:hypothetical protein [Candidatus Kaiserbacteria bacterium]
MQIITKKKQAELDAIAIKKLRFVARATLQATAQDGLIKVDSIPEGFIKTAEDRAEQVFYADDVM